MIRKPQNWENVQVMTDRAKLPVGAYVCKVKQVGIQHNDSGDQLAILYDIVEGEHKDFYARDFQQNQNPDKKWKGVIRIWLPKDDGSDKDETTKRIFKGMVTAFEDSNPGYKWNWDESTLVQKTIGILYRNEEWEYNSKSGWNAKPLRCMSAGKVRSGDFTLPQDKPLVRRGDAYDTGYTAAPAGAIAVETDELPF